MRVRLSLFTILTTLIVAVPSGAATLPHRTLIGPDQGVQATITGKKVQIRFTGASAAWGKKRAGQEAYVTCDPAPAPGLLFSDDGTTSGLGSTTGFEGEDADRGEDLEEIMAELGLAHLSSTGASVTAKVGDDAARADLCQVRTDGRSSADIAWAVLTPRGTVALEEAQRGLRMTDVIYAAAPHGTYRAAADVVALGGGEVVALDDPNGTPPAGKIGYWSKGRAVSVVSASATGRRLAIQDLGGGMLRTNAFDQLMSWVPAEPSSSSADPAMAGIVGGGPSDSDSGNGTDGDEDDDEVTAEEGLLARRQGDEVVFRFTGKAAKAYRAIARQTVRVFCIAAPQRPLLGEALTFGTPTITRLRVPAHGGTLRAKAPAGHDDMCWIETLDGGDVGFALLTPAARRYMVDFVVPLLFLFDERMPWTLAARDATRYPGVATILAAHPGLVGLASPGAGLAAGAIGVWTDAANQAVIAFGAPDGHRYVIADEGDGRIRTNAFTTLLGLMAMAGDPTAVSGATMGTP